MELLNILQFVTIGVSLFTLVFGYVFSAREKNKDQKTEIFTKKLLANVRELRKNMNKILAICNPDSIKEQLYFKNLQGSWRNFDLPFVLEESINNIKSIFFPFYSQENHMLTTLDSLKKSVFEFCEKPDDKSVELVLKYKIRNVYMEFAVYDRAMSDAISKQTTSSDFNNNSFDQFYHKIVTENKINLIKTKFEKYNRKNHNDSINRAEAQVFSNKQ